MKLQVSGISCAVCCGKIEQSLRALSGVSAVGVNPSTHVCSVGLDASADSALLDPLALKRAVESLGYGAKLLGPKDDASRFESPEDTDEWRRLLLLALALTAPLFGLQYLLVDETKAAVAGGATIEDSLMPGLATPMKVLVGRRFYRSAWLGLVHGPPTGDGLPGEPRRRGLLRQQPRGRLRAGGEPGL